MRGGDSDVETDVKCGERQKEENEVDGRDSPSRPTGS